MRKYGKTGAGTPRWFCTLCKQSTVWKRGDLTDLSLKREFARWLRGNGSLSELAQKRKTSARTVMRSFRKLWKIQLPKQPLVPTGYTLICDGVYIHKRECCVLVGTRQSNVLMWRFVPYETSTTWSLFFRELPQPEALVCDGQKGMLLAARTIWKEARIQRCLAHTMRSLHTYLTKHPQTIAGKNLQELAQELPRVWTRRQRRRWIHSYFRLFHRHSLLLKERSYIKHTDGTIQWWYTHRNLRSAYCVIKHSLPYLFTYVGHCAIPRTSNYVEGGINARLRELLRRHRGLTVEKKKVLTSYFLLSKQR